MAKPSDILRAEYAKGTISKGSRPYMVWDTTQGLTDELRNANIGKILGNTLLLKDADYNLDAVPPTLSDVLSLYGLKDSKDKKAVDKFIEQFPSKVQQWKKEALSHPKWGTSGWETIKKIYQQTVKDKGAEEAVKAREEAMRDAPLHFPVIGDVADPFPKATSKLTEIIAPRSVAAVKEGRTPGVSEALRDAVANLAYALPVGSGARILSTGRPVVNKVLQWGAQAVAPTGVAAMDNAADSTRTKQDFLVDAGTGTLANLGVNRLLVPMLARGASIGSSRVGAARSKVRDILEGAPTPKEEAMEIIQNAKAVMRDPAASAAEHADAADILSTAIVAKENAGARKAAAEAVAKARNEAAAVAAQNKAALKRGGVLAVDGIDEPRIAGDAITDYIEPFLTTEIIPDYSAILAKNPKLTALFAPKPNFVAPPVAQDFVEPAQTWAVNQLGSTGKAADVAGAMVPFGLVDVKKLREDRDKASTERRNKAQIADILKGDALTEEDKKWLGAVRENPDMLKFSQDEGFKKWLLTRGADLLRGTPMYRPAWDVE